MSEDKVYIVIPCISFNRYVAECIMGCLSLNYSNYTIVLLPDGKAKFPQEILSDPKLKILETRELTIAAKRNFGIRSVPDAMYYAFIDSDAYPHKEWLKNAISSFKASKDIWLVGGPSICPCKDEFRERITSNALKSVLVSGLNARNFREDGAQNGMRKRLPTYNLIAKREAIEQIGGFEENYITGEDLKLCSEVLKRKKKIFFSKDVMVYHHARRIFLPFIRQRVTWGLSISRLLKDDFTICNLFYLAPLLFILFSLFLLTLSWYHAIFRSVFAVMMVCYFSVILIEAFRWSARIRDIPHTFITLILGNLIPAAGILISLFHIPINIKKIYKNYESQD